ncbi:DUF4926 domain-containing protein [Neosynechococcus sphagnicola]|uniref:DUF4926 domain-containing protein n=1 Tax=Neosynechococcus sphagnicola TaxID=1501145 RepID=UPI0019553F54|nr:DUF4926 domain-containing protein [Neosynechococcus sphagnicola]
MNSTAKLLDVVALTVDLPQYNLWRGQVGTVVEILANGTAFEVEFSDRNGRTYESLGLRPEQIMVLHFEPTSPDKKRCNSRSISSPTIQMQRTDEHRQCIAKGNCRR